MNTNGLIKPNTHTPAAIIAYGQEAARELKNIVTKAGWVVKIGKNDYLQFEAWQTLARFYGLSAKTVSTNFVEYGKAKGFEAKAEVVDKQGNVIGAAEALCLDDEKNWMGKPLYALKSMSQTRACAKALRQILSWVVVLAGYKPTPADEVTPEVITNGSPTPTSNSPERDEHYCLIHDKPLRNRGGDTWDHRAKGELEGKQDDPNSNLVEGTTGLWYRCTGTGWRIASLQR